MAAPDKSPGAGQTRAVLGHSRSERNSVSSSNLALVDIMSTVRETAYEWDLTTNRIAWEVNAAEVLGLANIDDIATSEGFLARVAPEFIALREAINSGSHSSSGSIGVPFRTQYRFLTGGKRSECTIWLEDHGLWWADANGAPLFSQGILRVINERHREEQRLLYRSDHDELTGQLNRIRLTEALDGILSRAGKSNATSAILMVAVNNLAVINDTFGFDVGDEVISAVAAVIKQELRAVDVIGRYSSNKFGILLNDCGPASMRTTAERLMSAVSGETIQTKECQISATLSIGGVIVPEQASTVQQALSHALQALERAKQKRFEAYAPYEPNPNRSSARRKNIAIADDVIAALDHRRMHLVLQPMIDAKTKQPAIYECLLRMQAPDGRIVSAGEFMTVVEQLGMSQMVDRRVLELSIDLLKMHPDVHLSVNVSSLTSADHEWLMALNRLTEGSRELTGRMIVEITETTAIHDLNQTIAFVDTLKEMGCRVAIDDFGAGYTSFKNLKLLNADMVKIDGEFVAGLANDPSDRIFVKTLIDLAEQFDMETVAEWVGDQTTVDFLTEAGITYLQGFHYGMPIPADEFKG